LVEKTSTGRGQPDPVAAAFNQRNTDFILQGCDPPADDRLFNPEPSRGTSESAGFREGDETTEVLEFQVPPPA
jgi:hypothetical protein